MAQIERCEVHLKSTTLLSYILASLSAHREFASFLALLQTDAACTLPWTTAVRGHPHEADRRMIYLSGAGLVTAAFGPC